MKLCLTFVSIVVGFISISTASDIPKKPFHLNEKIEKEIGCAQVVRIGDTLYISGSVGAGEMPGAKRESRTMN
jgi:enamine deaminase RidA (YjgF/YER057c/UK114 family)